jgi:hypothetical protein
MEELRGAEYAPEGQVVFTVERGPIGGESELSKMVIQIGSDWAAWRENEADITLVDQKTDRILVFDADTETQSNSSLNGEARRRLDIFTALSQGGTLSTINFGDAGTFDRFWLEAAMGVAPPLERVQFNDTGSGISAFLDNVLVFTSSTSVACETLSESQIRGARIALRHSTSIHPEIMSRLAQSEPWPCAFSFVVYSPDSPNGRVETWTLTDPLPGENFNWVAYFKHADLRWPQSDVDPALGALLMSAVDAPAPDPVSFFEMISMMRAQNDPAGALLVSQQETFHFGPCPRETVGSMRLACVGARSLPQTGIGNPEFERALEGIQASLNGADARTISALEPYLNRNDQAGAAARILIAKAMFSLGQDGLAQFPHLDPAGLIIEALHIDPHATEVITYLAQRYLAAGAPELAWAIYDYARANDDRGESPSLEQLEALERNQRELMANWFAPQRESVDD